MTSSLMLRDFLGLYLPLTPLVTNAPANTRRLRLHCWHPLMLRRHTKWLCRDAAARLHPPGRHPARRRYASIVDAKTYPSTGEHLYGFTLKATKHVPELELTAIHLQHDKTGAEYLHIAKEDKNNVFSIGFKTNPPDHTGVPHILEHVTLCGSKKYPVRDPFFKMMPRSLSNFMNAMTSSENTVYPFATTNPQDFKNLLSVYMDATLHPLLKEKDFKQEGWRIGPENPLAKSSGESRLLFKGVVYNEMKGQMSNADYLFQIRFQNHIFPAIEDSGGDPSKMTDLTYEQLKKFHADHYHPSNAKILTYGDIPLAEHLKEIGPSLDEFNKIVPDGDPRDPIRLDDGHEIVTVQGPLDPLYPKDQQYKASISWLTCDTSDILETFSLGLISSLLLDGFAAPIYQNTIGIGWGASYTPNTGFDPSSRRAIFSVGLSGLRKHDVERLNEGIMNTLRSVKRSGFKPEKVEGRLHQLELGMKHKTAGFGMEIISRLQGGWFNCIQPLKTVNPEEIISAFKNAYGNEGYLEELIDKYLLRNNTFTFVMEPSEDFGSSLATEEASRLERKLSELVDGSKSPEEVRKVLEAQELELLKEQDTAGTEDVSCLPSVYVKDIPRQSEQKQFRHTSIDGTQIQWREAPTNGLTYFRAIRTLKDLPDELRIYLPLFSSAIQRIGTKTLPVELLEDHTRLRTGGISVGYHSSTSPLALDACEEGISFAGSALDKNVPYMYDLLLKMLTETDFDKRGASEQIMELVKGFANSAVSEVAESGHSYARRFASAGLTPQARIDEEIGGMTQMRLLMDLASRSPSDGLADVLEKLKTIQSFVISKGDSLRVALTCGMESASSNEAELRNFLDRIPAESPAPVKDDQVPYPRDAKSFFPLPYQVYYTSMAFPTVPYTHVAGAPLQILAQLLTNKHLHHEIREKGGAYGGGAYSRGLGGIFGFYSYRDPNPQNTLKIMADAGAWAREHKWSERDIEEAKLSVFQSLDAPESVSQEGMTLFLSGVDPKMEQTRREQLLDVSAKDVNEVADRYVVSGLQNCNVAVLGEKREWVNEENGWVEMPMSQIKNAGDGDGDGDESGYVVL